MAIVRRVLGALSVFVAICDGGTTCQAGTIALHGTLVTLLPPSHFLTFRK
jgi:hypothetical protein